jgi:hypothetical protein
MIGKKINQLATELAPVSTDLTIIGDPISGVSKKITLAQLGAIFSGAVSFYTDLASFPVVGDINVIYCAKDTQKLYLWSGSAYVEVFPSQALLDTYQLRSEKGNANGYASLDSGGKVPISQLPSSIMEYKGTWNASTNTPTLANGTGDTGDVYICNVAGTVNFGAGPITFAVGDYVIYSGTIWQRSSGAVGTVTSVAASITGNSIGITGSPITTSGTLALAFAGTSAQYINGAGNLITFPTSLISGSGASGQVTFFNGANSVTGTNNFFWDATNNRLGIGTTTPQRSIEIYNTTADNHLRLSGNAPSVSMGEAVTGSIYQAKFGLVTTNGQFVSAGVAGDFVIISQTGATIIGTSSTEKMRVNTSGNVSINNTNNTYKLDVTGTGRYTGQLRLESTITDGTNTYTLPSATGTLALTSDIPSVTGYVPYTGATANLDLGTHTLIAAKGTFSSSGSGDTVGITHSSGSGIAINITKGGNGEGLYINKTSGSGNAATIIGTLNATTLVKSGGTSSQFLKADGSVDSSTYLTTSAASSTYLPLAGGTLTGALYINYANPVLRFKGATLDGYIINSTDKLYIADYNTATKGLIVDLSTGALSQLGSGNVIFNSNLGLGVSPSAWNSALKTIQALNASISNNGGTSVFGSNVYYDSSYTPRYISSTLAGAILYNATGGEWSFNTAPSGTAGNAISFTQAMTLDASGRLGIGTTSPSNKLDVLATAASPNLTGTNAYARFYQSGGFANITIGALASGSFAGWLQSSDGVGTALPLAINPSGGNVGIGTTSPSYKLVVNSGTEGISAGISGATYGIRFDNGGVNSSGMSTIHGVDTTLVGSYQPIRLNGLDVRFGTSDTERMRITSGGQVLINRTSAASSEEVLGILAKVNTTAFDIQIGTNSYYGIRFRNSSGSQAGYIQIDASSVTYGTGSDYRLKKDFKDYSGLDLVSKINTYDFAWKLDNTRMYGVIAHELANVMPYAVSGKKDAINKDGSINPQGVDYSKIVPVLIKSIQELKQELDTLKNK